MAAAGVSEGRFAATVGDIALDRLALLGGRHAGIIIADRHALTQVLSTVVPRAAD